MTLTHALGRIGQLEATLSRFTVAPEPLHRPAPSTPAPSASAVAAPAAGAATHRPGADFEALMRVLNYAEGLSAGPPASTSPARTGRGEVSAASGITAPTGIAAPTGTSETGTDAVELAKNYLGVPYVWGGNDPNSGLDCSGLVKLVYEQLGVSLPRVAKDQATRGREVSSLAEAEPGDLIVTYEGGHIGIYVGDGNMIHAPRPGRSVSIDPVSHYTDHRGIMTIRRVLDSASETALSQSASVEAAADRRQFEAQAGANA